MRCRMLQMGVLALCIPVMTSAQGRQTKVDYDHAFRFGSQQLHQAKTRYFQVLTTPAPEDSADAILRYWGPKLDTYFERVCANLQLDDPEIHRYLLYPAYFAQLEKLVLEGRLHRTWFEAVLQRVCDLPEDGSLADAGTALVLAPASRPMDPARSFETIPRTQRWEDRYVETSGDTAFVWLPREAIRLYQRCVLYRTVHDFLATPIGPPLPEGVLGFVPRHDPELPVVIYASLGERRLRRTAQHEVAHAVVENIAKYLRRLASTRNRYARGDSARPAVWRPSRGGFSAITHENYAEYLAFPPGEMEPTLRSSLIELVAENRLDGLAALSVGARTIASSYVEGPARLHFLAQRYGPQIPKQLLVGYYTHSSGFLDRLEDLTGESIRTLERLYRRWLRSWLWDEYLATDIPDTLGQVLTAGLSGVQRDGHVLVHRVRDGRQEIALVGPPRGPRHKREARIVVRDLDGTERLPLFSTSDWRQGHVVTSVRSRNEEALLLWDAQHGARTRRLDELGAVREVRDPRWSPDTRQVVFRVVDRSGRNALALYDVEADRARCLTPWSWPEISDAAWAESRKQILFASTATSDGTSDVFLLDLEGGGLRNLTQTPGISETEPLLIHGHLVCLSEARGVPVPVEWDVERRVARDLMHLPFPVSHLQHGDSTLTLVANSVRFRNQPASRAIWSFPLRRLGLDTPGPELAPPLPVADQDAPLQLAATQPLLPSPRLGVAALLGDAAESESVGLLVSPYRQKWRLMPLGLNFNGTGTRRRGLGFMGIDTEFHDQSLVVAAGQSGDFDRFGMLQYRNRAARTHWHASIYHRSVVRTRFEAMSDSVDTINRNESETGVLLGAQVHKSLTTRLGAGLALVRRADARGRLVAREEDTATVRSEAPVLGLQLTSLDPRRWDLAVGGLSDLSLLTDRSPMAADRWMRAERAATTQAETEFLPSLEYARANATLNLSLSHDTRVWADPRGPHSGALTLVRLSGGYNLPGERLYIGSARQDSLSEGVASGIDRVAATALYLTHRRLSAVDVAFRARAFVNDGPQALVYGLGGLYSVGGFGFGTVRSEKIAYGNLEARVQIWDYSRLRLPVRSLPFPAADGFVFFDGGVAHGHGPIYSYGLGWRLRLGFLAWEWRHPLRDGLRSQNGLTFLW